MRSALRRVAATLSATALVAAGAATAAPPASASTSTDACTTQLDLPGRVSTDRPLHQARIATDDRCGVEAASFDVLGPRGYSTTFDVDRPTGDPYAIWDIPSSLRPGTCTARSGTPGYVPTSAVLEYCSKIDLRAGRWFDDPRVDPAWVDMEVCASCYTASRGAHLPWRDHRVVLQNTDAYGRYQYLTTVRTGADGCFVGPVTNTYDGQYRAVAYETYKIFSRTSPGQRVGGIV
ncbi:hypothetical protein WDV85_00505 [Pseudokineococcus sp. 5B2Z-1]|uniref:hypothetical protein n=1 Tax=Pseudokineococcus sp. 5B2Z-1 TaxID=3132744 RepID=UPI0030A148BC